MAKGKSGRSGRPDQSTRRTRDVPIIASPEVLSFEPDLSPRSVREVTRADRRMWDPDPVRPVRTSSGIVARTTHKPPAKPARASQKPPAFSVPSYPTFVPQRGRKRPLHVPECHRRKQRREVIFARGKGGGGHKRPRWSSLSHVRCR